MPSRVCCGAASAGIRVKYNSFGKRVLADTPHTNPPKPARKSAEEKRKSVKSVRFSDHSVEEENSVNERLDGSVMDPLYATVRKRNSATKERSGSVPQVPLNIQPTEPMFQPTEQVFQPSEQGFRPYNNIRQGRHFRQNTDLWIHGYKVNLHNI